MSSNVRDTARKIRQSLQGKYPAGEADAMTAIIFEKVMNYSRVDMIMREDSEVPEFASARIDDAVARLLRNEPIQHIFGEARFAGHTFKVTPDTLIPRPETEQLVDMIAGENTAPDLRVLDIGTGSGCIAISLAIATKWPQVSAIDISPAALAVARDNAKALRARVAFSQADILTAVPEKESLDIIVSNPPYIDEQEKQAMDANVLDYEPATALFVPDDNPLLFYRAIQRYAMTALKPGGRLYFEINPRHAAEMKEMLAQAGWRDIDCLRDFYGRERFTSCTKPTEP